MIHYRRNAFKKAHRLLDQLRSDDSSLEPMLQLQELLITEIMRAEAGVRHWKYRKDNIDQPEKGMGVVTVTRRCERMIEGYRQINFIWRCFGDALAFYFQSKFALKQFFYNTHNYNVKQAAGFLSGKSGLAAETALLRSAIAYDVPAVLCDLTNTIRHGDVCLLGGADPVALEVKTSRNKDARGKRQMKELDALHRFLETDQAENFRGLAETRRIAYTIEEKVYDEVLNDCIAQAYRDGYAMTRPETGLAYVAIRHRQPTYNELFVGLNLKSSIISFMNEYKRERAWAPLYPFTLTIKDETHLYDFVSGNLTLIVILDTSAIDPIASSLGYSVEFDPSQEDYPLRFKSLDRDGEFRSSRLMLSRIFLECVSLDWLIRTTVGQIEAECHRLPIATETAP